MQGFLKRIGKNTDKARMSSPQRIKSNPKKNHRRAINKNPQVNKRTQRLRVKPVPAPAE
jgi:hypothetical protein